MIRINKKDLYSDPYYKLAIAVVERACIDYVENFFKQYTASESRRLPNGKITKNYRLEAKRLFESAKAFFELDRQNEFLIFTDLRGLDIMKELDRKILERVVNDLKDVQAYCNSMYSDCRKCAFYNNTYGVCNLDEEPFRYDLPE